MDNYVWGIAEMTAALVANPDCHFVVQKKEGEYAPFLEGPGFRAWPYTKRGLPTTFKTLDAVEAWTLRMNYTGNLIVVNG